MADLTKLAWAFGKVTLDSTMVFSKGYDYDLMDGTSMIAEGRHGWYQVWRHFGMFALYRQSDGGFDVFDSRALAEAAATLWDAEEVPVADLLLASELPGLIDHWTGPVTYTYPDGEVEAGVCWSYGYIYLIHERRLAEPGSVAVELSEWPEVRDRVVRWCLEGETCPGCGGRGAYGEDGYQDECHSCDGDGWLRAPCPEVEQFRDRPDALRWVALRVAAGEPTRGILEPWGWRGPGDDRGYYRRRLGEENALLVGGRARYATTPRSGWSCNAPEVGEYAGGPETGAAGKAAADRAAIAAGYWLEPDGQPFDGGEE